MARNKVPGGWRPRSWREDVDDALLDAEPEAAEPDRINAYVCDMCRGVITTRDVHKGVTPMFLACRAGNGCGGTMQSCMYSLAMLAMHRESAAAAAAGREVSESFVSELIAQGWDEPEWEWFMPTLRQIRRMGERLAEHSRKGGLSLRRVEA